MPPLTREDRRSLALHAAIAERLCGAPEAVLTRACSTLARMRAAHPGARGLFDEWSVLLDGPAAALLAALCDPSPRARELRHVTPFAGILSARERATVYQAFATAERQALARATATRGVVEPGVPRARLDRVPSLDERGRTAVAARISSP